MARIEYYRKSVYGEERLYIVGDDALVVSQLTNKKTVTIQDLKALDDLGVKSVEVLAPR
jgi:hypothetical protein